MVMKASVEDDDSGWELSMPEKMEKSSANWVDITRDFVEACGELKLGELLHDKLRSPTLRKLAEQGTPEGLRAPFTPAVPASIPYTLFPSPLPTLPS